MAVTTYTLELRKGARTLDLMSGRYKADFVPPAVNLTPQLASGTSANRYGGALKVGQRAADRSISLLIHIRGQSEREISAGAGVVRAFLDQAGDESEPVYLVYWPNSDTPEPLWGQGRLYYEVLSSQMTLDPIFGQRGLREKATRLSVTLLVKPFALGRKQRLVSAKGALREDVEGKNFSRGLLIQDGALTNIFTNPVFGHTTYDNGWTTAAALVSEKNTDEKFILFGAASARLYCITTATGAFTQSLTLAASTHILSCYAKREDGAAITGSDVNLIYNGAEPSASYIAVGDGWSLIRASITGTGGAAAIGVSVQYPRQVYVDGFQVVASADARPFFFGDLLGCAWSGTAHASTSTQAASVLTITATDDTLREAQGCVRILWRPYLGYDAALATQYLFSSGASGLNAYYQASDDKFYLTDGTNTVSTAAQTFTAFNLIFLHFVWGPSGLAIYKDGASAASGASFDPVAAATLYLLCNSSSAQQAVGTAMDFTIFGVELTAAQVLDDFNNLTQIASDVERVGALPWLWTKDGDSIVDNADDSTRDNWAVIGSIPGSLDAQTRIKCLKSNAHDQIIFSNARLEDFLLPDGWSFFDLSGTADVGNSSGDAYQTLTNVSTGGNTIQSSELSVQNAKILKGLTIRGVIRLNDAGSNLQVSVGEFLGGLEVNTEFKSVTTTAAFRLVYTDAVSFTETPFEFLDWIGINANYVAYQFRAKRTSGTANLSIDYFALLPTPFMIIGEAGNSLLRLGVLYDSLRKTAWSYNDALDELIDPINLHGDILELSPSVYNILFCYQGDTGINPTVSHTLTYSRVEIRPRYALL